MSIEALLVTALQAQCPRVFPDVAPFQTLRPYVIYQQIGGKAPTYLDDNQPATRCAWMQIAVYADTRAQASALMLSIETALHTSATLQARAQSAMQATHDEDTDVRGAMQDFEIWGAR